MTLYEKFGISVGVDQYLWSLQNSMNAPDRDDLIPSVKDDIPCYSSVVATCYYLLGDLANARKFARQNVWATLEYLCGKWRNEVRTDDGDLNPKWWRAHSSWSERFRESLCWASCVGEWDAVARLVEYPDEDCKVDIGTTKEDKAIYIALARYLRKEQPNAFEDNFQAILRGKKQKPKLLMAILKSLLAQDSAAFDDTMCQYLRYFRKSEFKRTSLKTLLCFDGTTLLNLGAKMGCARARTQFATAALLVPFGGL